MNLNDDIYEHVTYTCLCCGASKTITGQWLGRIASDFEVLGWTNTPVDGDDGKTEYIVLCPDCVMMASLDTLADDLADINDDAYWAQYGVL